MFDVCAHKYICYTTLMDVISMKLTVFHESVSVPCAIQHGVVSVSRSNALLAIGDMVMYVGLLSVVHDR
jgi:hypothetical protein